MTDKHPQVKGYLFTILSAILYGLMPLFTKVAYAYGSDPYQMGFYRFFYSIFILFPLVFQNRKRVPMVPEKRELQWLLLLSFIYATLPLTLYGSYRYISASLASSLHFTYPVFVMILSVPVLKTPIKGRQLVCAAICAAGIVLLTQNTGGINLTGVVLALLSGLFYACYVVALAKSGLKEMPVIKMVFWLSVFTSAMLFVAAFVTGNRIVLPGTWQVAVAQILLAAVSTVLPLALFQRGLAIIGAVKSTLLSTFEPITGVLVGVIAFHDVLTLRSIIGIALILVAAMLLVKE